MSKQSICKGRCTDLRKFAYYWEGYKRCNQCERFIRTDSDICHCCRGSLRKNGVRGKIQTIHNINIYSDHIRINYDKLIMKYELREIFDEYSLGNKITVLNNNHGNMISDPEILFIIINYFAGKKYRLGRPIGHGNEQIQFIKYVEK